MTMNAGFVRATIVASFALAIACGGGDPKDPVTAGDDDEVEDPNNGLTPTAPWNTVTFTTQDVELKSPALPTGMRGKLVRDNAGTLYYVYFRTGPTVPDCNIAISGLTSPSISYDVVVAVKPASASTFTLERVPLENGAIPDDGNDQTDEAYRAYISNPLGLDATIDGQNRLVVTTMGGAKGLFTCGSSDLLLITRTATNTYNVDSPIINSSACCDGIGPAPEQCGDGSACTSGSDAGAWAAITRRSSGSLAIAYADLHNAVDNDGLTKADFELWQSSGGDNVATGIRPWSGNGFWSQLREFDERLIAVTSSSAGQGATVLIQQDNNSWAEQDQSFGAVVGERLQLEVAPNGITVGLVYYAVADKDGTVEDLYLCESSDGGVTFPTCSKPESATLIAGQHPSLAYDPQSRPILSYYYCGSRGCSNDGLRVAWRDSNGKWWKFNVQNIAQNSAGYYSSVVVDPATGAPTIVFQDITRGAAMVAYGKFN